MKLVDSPKGKSKTGYVCGVAFDLELEKTDVKICPTPVFDHDTRECGIAEVQIVFVRWVKEPEEVGPPTGGYAA